ncbi:MAG: HEPN domain-containing protein [Methanothrix sp.]|nr:HEPN domain-containing protein [Methanothrix sp.]
MKNIQKTRDWMEMALDDMDDAIADFRNERYPSSVFHAQQCSEKLLKSILYYFGIFHEKTHFPSDVLIEDILNSPDTTRGLILTKDQIGFLLSMADNAASIEKQRSMPRYGWETRDRIIKPSEIYNEDKAKEIMERSKTVLTAARGFFSTIGAGELDEVLKRIEQCLKK